MRKRELIGFCCVLAVLSASGGSAKARGEAPPDAHPDTHDSKRQPLSSSYLVREVVYNELHDHDSHGYWRFWIERHSDKGTQIHQEVETPDGPIARLESVNGQPVGREAREEEDRRLQRLLNSPSEQAQHRKDYTDDEKRIGRIVALLPDAFIYEPAILEPASEQMPECACYHMHFHPNPNYPAHSIEARIFHAMAGDLWISVDQKRLVRLDAKLQDNVDFGYGFLGRLYKDGWFRLDRTHVGATDSGAGDWKTKRLEIHMAGRAMLFKTIARETSEVRGGFERVPSGLSLEQAAAIVRQTGTAPSAQAAALSTSR